MQSTLRIETKILPGNKIEINLPTDMLSSSVGQTVEVIVLLPEQPQLMRQNILEWIEQARGKGPFRSVEEINRDLQAERDSWDS
ncbi:hypothetical protein [Iningainema tapete]|uniref:Uncharacterized protein n=1 Tax=Iningainema tapete BLCC-T55 TaxID=2748662 RepID=A0A8J6XI36_9CYAN|nr:hypothetical protein [Iningainema tapete]MBD2773650.1 hypothetical protein [Iningainema tapete BLCC-T55]